jgi:hypothetical protein
VPGGRRTIPRKLTRSENFQWSAHVVSKTIQKKIDYRNLGLSDHHIGLGVGQVYYAITAAVWITFDS